MKKQNTLSNSFPILNETNEMSYNTHTCSDAKNS